MPEEIYLTRTLEYYDWILHFEAQDSAKRLYMGIAGGGPGNWDYAVVPYPDAERELIRAGEIPISPMFAQATEWWFCDQVNGPGEPTPVERREGRVPDIHLPLDGFYLDSGNFEWGAFPFDRC